MKIKRARRALRGQISDIARKQFDDYLANLKPSLWAETRALFSPKYRKQWIESRVEAFIKWQNRQLKRIQKRAERRIAYASKH